jgi:hypothetical protein
MLCGVNEGYMTKITLEQICDLSEGLDRLISIFSRVPTLDAVTASEMRQEREFLRKCLAYLEDQTPDALQEHYQKILVKFHDLSLLITARSPISEKN